MKQFTQINGYLSAHITALEILTCDQVNLIESGNEI